MCQSDTNRNVKLTQKIHNLKRGICILCGAAVRCKVATQEVPSSIPSKVRGFQYVVNIKSCATGKRVKVTRVNWSK